MRAVVLAGPGRVEVADVPEPVVREPTDAIVRVTRSAICGSDLHFVHGKTPTAPGAVLGHEAVGVVEEAGGAVGSFSVGDRVVLSFAVACGSCWFCARGQTSLCDRAAVFGAGPFGGDLPGAQAELVRVPWADVNMLAVPAGLDDDRAVFVGDVLTTGYHAASLTGFGDDDAVAVLGAGPLGWCVAASLRSMGAGRVFLLDREASRLELAAAAGATPLDVAHRSAESALAEVTEDRGPDVTIDAVGAADAYRDAVAAVRRGGRVVVAGVYAGESVELQLGVAWARALDVRFTGVCPVHRDWREVMRRVDTGEVDPSPLVSERVALEDAPGGYERFERRVATKVLIEP
ncbi:MAG TPA: alcohol dehydrogenase catalytic domain-containing protein [Actinomycetota bacterium]|jgi:threonine dehydrogenase-like Zn-dependent dehydrogenase